MPITDRKHYGANSHKIACNCRRTGVDKRGRKLLESDSVLWFLRHFRPDSITKDPSADIYGRSLFNRDQIFDLCWNPINRGLMVDHSWLKIFGWLKIANHSWLKRGRSFHSSNSIYWSANSSFNGDSFATFCFHTLQTEDWDFFSKSHYCTRRNDYFLVLVGSSRNSRSHSVEKLQSGEVAMWQSSRSVWGKKWGN